jgi:hypothetical protein
VDNSTGIPSRHGCSCLALSPFRKQLRTTSFSIPVYQHLRPHCLIVRLAIAVSSPTGPKHEVNLIGQQVKPGASYISATSILSWPIMRPTPSRARAAPKSLVLQNVAASLRLNIYQPSPFDYSNRLGKLADPAASSQFDAPQAQCLQAEARTTAWLSLVTLSKLPRLPEAFRRALALAPISVFDVRSDF